MPSYKHDRIAEDIRREITLLIRDLKDPRIKDKMLTVVRVEVSSDASYAKVYISDFNGIDGAKEAVQALTAATGRIRREVGQKLHLRKTPEIKFIADDSVEQGVELFKKLDAAEGRGTKDED